MSHQDKLTEEKDEFVESLGLTPEKIREDLEKMRDIEGFPIGDVEDILELSDPPYYTAYPNPYIKDFIEIFGTPYKEETDDYDIEPFLGDISKGKNEPIYNIHYYHTKVPPAAIKPLINHYTKKNDLIIDVFSGSGMTGIASGDDRNVILIDLGIAASYISSNFNITCDMDKLKANFLRILEEVKSECDWMYKTNVDGVEKQVKYFVWSKIVICPNCGHKQIYYDISVQDNKTNKEAQCHKCSFKGKKNSFIETIDGKTEYGLVKIIYADKGNKEKIPDSNDLNVIKKIEKLNIPFWYPDNRMPKGDESRRNDKFGLTNINDFFTKRNLYILASFFDKARQIKDKKIKNHLYFLFTSGLPRLSKLTRYMPEYGHRHVGPLSGTLYIPPFFEENNAMEFIEKKFKKFIRNSPSNNKNAIISTQSSTDLQIIPNNSIDYIFIDPPFGSNLMYSELNILIESWLRIFTNNKEEAIINDYQNKGLYEYENLIYVTFESLFKKLKPNRWISIEFHNSKAEVWKSIQNALSRAGFVIAQISILDKKKGTTKQLIYDGAVKHDLLINAYKPSQSFTQLFIDKAGFNLEKKFIQMHLDKLPIADNIERTSQMIYSKLLAQYLQNSFEVRMDASEFYDMLRNNFDERNGYWFNPEQIFEYEKKLKLKIEEKDKGQTVLGVYDEKSAIRWLIKFLEIPRTYNEIFIEFSKNLLTSQDKMPELKNILDENFITENGNYRLPSDLERENKKEIRKKHLLKDFSEIFTSAQAKKKIKDVRKEALLFGLMNLYQQKDVEKIKLIGDSLDQKIIDSDDDISAIIDWAMYN